MKSTPAQIARFAAAAHRAEAANRAQSPLAFQREFAVVLEGWADRAEREAEEAERGDQPALFRPGGGLRARLPRHRLDQATLTQAQNDRPNTG